MNRTFGGMVFAAAMVIAGCGGKRSTTDDGPSAVPKTSKDLPPGLDLRLSNGKAGAPAYDRSKVATTTKLADAEVAAVLARTKPLVPDPADKQAFTIRPSSQPAPRTGTTITTTFPPPAQALLPPTPTDAGKELRVVRYMPEGNVPLAPELTVTFSQPMVAVTSQDDAAAVQPVKLTPQPPGTWRWIGTRTIVFDPQVRFPQATTYRVEIPAGTKGISGAAIKEPATFSFETPPPKVVASYPYEGVPQRLDVPVFLAFDQKIDPKAVLAKLQLRVNGNVIRGLRLLDAAELEKDRELKTRVASAKSAELDGRWLAFRPSQKLPSDAAIEIVVPVGTPSAEGPNTTTVWHVKAGARVRIKLAVANENRRYHVALVDPLPAGLEPLNPTLATTGPVPPSERKDQRTRGGPYWYWYGPWYDHQNLRDERVEAFASTLWEGVHDYEYVARATTPGTFIVPPPKAEEMYMPETFGRGASDKLIVE